MTPSLATQSAAPFNWEWLDWTDIRPWLRQQTPRVIATIGYGAEGAPERLADASVLASILRELGIHTLVDVRAQPSGGRVREPFRQGRIKEAFAASPTALEYVWKGNDLGGTHRHRGRATTDDGLRWLDALGAQQSCMLLCACAERSGCHACRIIATDLIDPVRRRELGLSTPAPTFLHLHLDGSFTDGVAMLEAADEQRHPIAHTLQCLPQHRRAADYWRDVYMSGEPIDPRRGHPG